MTGAVQTGLPEAADSVLCSRRGPLGHILLNRPRSLNALTLPMIQVINPALQAWEEDSAVRAVVIEGAGEKAFCAGGDVRAVYDSGLAIRRGEEDAGALTQIFFYEEYRLNHRISRFPKPYIALMDGITMGGGVGLSAHGSYRVATERTLWAMPETAIGLFPDVGASHVLGRLPDQVGVYLGLTGARLGAADCWALGLATHVVPAAAVPALVTDLESAEWEGEEPAAAVDSVLARHAMDPGPAPLAAHRAAIAEAFAGETVESIRDRLAAQETDWARQTLATLDTMSPTSLKVTLRQLRTAPALSLAETLQRDAVLGQHFMRGDDFYEGIRAVLVDKDRSPKWRPADLAGVSDALVEAHFVPGGEPPLSVDG